jgi:uncharacterized protein (TIGR00297 family)
MAHLDNLLVGLVLGLILSGGVSWLAYRRGSLATSGVAGAMTVGTLIFGFGGWVWGLTLIAFFVSSSALSHYKEAAKQELAEKFAKGHRRDLGQTLANGGAGALAALAHTAWGKPLLFAAFLGALATVNADTWATELGVLDPSPPRLITNGRVVEVGTSGGVSWLGTIASVAGALTIGLAALVFSLVGELLTREANPLCYGWAIPAALVGGWVGSLVDSLLGASVQAIYLCPTCGKETEKQQHGCGTPTQHQRGWHWLNNDVVNFFSSLAGALVAVGIFLAI